MKRLLRQIVLTTYVLWVVGDILGVALAAVQPLWFRYNFIGVPSDHHQMLRYAWVGGSIWGAYFGGAVAVIVGLARFGWNWRRIATRQSEPWQPI